MVAILFTLIMALMALTPSLARVGNMTAPSTASPGQNITTTLKNEVYIQNWDDFGVIWGLRPSDALPCESCLGLEISYNNLYNQTAPFKRNETFSVPIPSSTETGDYTLIAAIPYIVGASGGTGIRYFNSSITIE